MSESRKVTSAYAVSVLVHLSLFTVLALMPAANSVSATKDISKAATGKPLEVTFQAAAVATPAPIPDQRPISTLEDVTRAQLEPDLRNADHAPENATLLASHDSVAANPARNQRPDADGQASAATRMLALNAPVLSVQKTRPEQNKPVSKEKAEGAPDGTGTDEALGKDAEGSYGLAIDKALRTSSWFSPQVSNLSLISVGEVVIEFAIDASGSVSGIHVVSDNTGNSENARLAIRSVSDTKFPPVPPEILSRSPEGRKVFRRTFVKNPTL